MLVETAIGDAYGAGFEYAPKLFVEANNDLAQYYAHPKWQQDPGKYTDDTQMSISTAEAVILIRDGDTLTKRDFAEMFLLQFRRDHRKGYSQHFYSFLCGVKDVDDFMARINPDSEKSGAAMRAGPISLLPDIEQVKKYSDIQASVTHDTVRGRTAARAAALAVHFFRYPGRPERTLGEFLNTEAPIDTWNWESDWGGQVKAPGWHSVAAAVTGLRKHDNLADTLKWIVNLRGDVDTAAAIAMSIGSVDARTKSNLPLCLYEGLEDGYFGRPYLTELDRYLKSKFLLS